MGLNVKHSNVHKLCSAMPYPMPMGCGCVGFELCRNSHFAYEIWMPAISACD